MTSSDAQHTPLDNEDTRRLVGRLGLRPGERVLCVVAGSTVAARLAADLIGPIDGKSDFLLQWNLDGRDRESRFDLDKGETYVEHEFRVGVNQRYGRQHPYTFRIFELDRALRDSSRPGTGNAGDQTPPSCRTWRISASTPTR